MKPMTPVLALLTILGLTAGATEAAGPAPTAEVKAAKLGTTRKVHSVGPIWLASQPAAEDFMRLRTAKIGTVVTLRKRDETNWDEGKVARQNDMTFHQLGFNSPDELDDKLFASVRGILRSADQDHQVLLHCAGSNRVGAVWMAYRVLDQGVSIEQADREAKQVGLVTPVLRTKALEYIQRQQRSQGADD
ncbi:MAG: hypothetical protein AAGA03_07535 [Planctomycetota bacterium]